MSNNEQKGGASPHTGHVAEAIVRSKGDAVTMSAMESKTRSPYKSTEKHYEYESCGEGWGGNVKR